MNGYAAWVRSLCLYSWETQPDLDGGVWHHGCCLAVGHEGAHLCGGSGCPDAVLDQVAS